jgi:cytochrome c-type biogenesis protein CcsB
VVRIFVAVPVALEPEAAMTHLNVLFALALYGYLLATVITSVWFFWRRKAVFVAGASALGVAAALQGAFLTAWGVQGGRPPFKDTFETLVFLATCLAVFFLLSLLVYRSRPLAPLASLSALFVTLLANFMMPEEVGTRVPALRNDLWLTVHVIFCFVSYAAFFIAYAGALAHLAKERRHALGAALCAAFTVSTAFAVLVALAVVDAETWQKSRGTVLLLTIGGSGLGGVALWPAVAFLAVKARLRELMPEKRAIEKMVYKAVAFGFPFLTLGIITGSYWASQAWGRYWGWDDKEVASLITWLVFAVYLHLRLVPKWRGPWVTWVAAAGFWCVIFTYFGVNYLLGGLHSYG